MIYCWKKTLVRIGVCVSFPTKDDGKKVDVDVCLCSHIPEEGRYLQACFFKIFFHCLVHILQCWVIGSLCFRKKPQLIKNPNQFNVEGKIMVMTLVSPFCRVLHVVLGLLIRTVNTIGAYLKF